MSLWTPRSAAQCLGSFSLGVLGFQHVRLDAYCGRVQGSSYLHHFAGKESSAEVVLCLRALLEAGADPNARNLQGSTPLHVAAAAGSLITISIMLEARAQTKTEDNFGMTPHDIAEVFEHTTEVLEALSAP